MDVEKLEMLLVLWSQLKIYILEDIIVQGVFNVYNSNILFLMIPINLSKKNRMYKVMHLVFKYLFKCKEYIFRK